MNVQGLIDFINEVADNGGYRERKELIDAYNNGLDWFMNFDQGVQEAMYDLEARSLEDGFTGLPKVGE